MKKSSLIIFCLLLLTIILFGVFLIINMDENKNRNYKKVDYTSSANFTSDKQLIAIAYLNDMAELSSKYISNLENIKVYNISDDKKFLIIPRYDDIEIQIYNTSLEEGILVKDELLTTTNLPFVITCDNSSVIFEIKYNDIIFEYSLSEKNITNDYILDITK